MVLAHNQGRNFILQPEQLPPDQLGCWRPQYNSEAPGSIDSRSIKQLEPDRTSCSSILHRAIRAEQEEEEEAAGSFRPVPTGSVGNWVTDFLSFITAD